MGINFIGYEIVDIQRNPCFLVYFNFFASLSVSYFISLFFLSYFIYYHFLFLYLSFFFNLLSYFIYLSYLCASILYLQYVCIHNGLRE